MSNFVNKNDKQGLIRLIQENPELPLIFLVCNDDITFDYGSTVLENFYCNIDTVYFFNEYESDDYEDVFDYYSDYLCDNDEYKDLSDEEYSQAVKDYIEQNVKHYKAIIVNVVN